jgi:cytochrome c
VRVVALLIATAAAVLAGAAVSATQEPAGGPRILAFTKTAAFRHSSIPAALRAVRELGAQNGLVVDATEDAGEFTPANLARYEAVVFLLTTGDVLNGAQQAAFERFIRQGGGFAGVHSAADTEYGWPWYGGLIGARFRSHPHIQQARVDVVQRHPSTAGLPRRWTRTDEWYNFAARPAAAVRVLARLDEGSYSPGAGAMGHDHPIAWVHEYRGGRAWFTGGGHTDESYSEPGFRRHLIGGIRYAAGLTPPRIASVSAKVQKRRLSVSVRYRSCRPCSGRLEVLVRSRRTRAALRFGGATARARSAALPRGRWRFSVVLTDPKTGVRHSARRSVRVR